MKYRKNTIGFYAALTLPEMVLAMSIMAVVMAVILVQFRAILNSWDSKAGTGEVIQNGRIMIDHLNRNLSKAVRITDVSSAAETDGYIEFEDNDGNTLRYDIAANDYVEFGVIGSLSDLAGPVSMLQFTCYDACDLDTPITDINSIRFVKVQTTLTNSATLGQDKTFTAQAYLRVSGNSTSSGGSVISAIAYSNLTSYGILKTVEIAGTGDITDTVIDSLEFDASYGGNPKIIHVSDSVYAIAYRGYRDDGFLKTVEIADTGAITDTVIDTLEFDTANCLVPKIIHVSGDFYAIAYSGRGEDGFLKTVEIAANGQITDTEIDELEFDTVHAEYPDIIHVSGDVYAIAYNDEGWIGFLKTVGIAHTNGMITPTVYDTLQYSTNSSNHRMIHVSGDVYAICYHAGFGHGVLKTVEIATNGQIQDTVIDTMDFTTNKGYWPDIIHVSGDVYAIAAGLYPGAGDLRTVEIYADGQISDTVIDSMAYDTVDGQMPDIINISGNVYAIGYWGPDEDGFLTTVEIAANGQITDTAIDSLEFDTVLGRYASIVNVSEVPGSAQILP